jgi:hypothetical protein
VGSAIGVAEVDARLVAPGFGQFAFLFLVFGELFVGVGERIARSEHGIASGLFFLLPQRAEFMADLTDGALDGLHFDEQIADFFEKVVKMVGSKHVGKARGFQMDNVLAAGLFRDEIQNADAGAISRRDAGKLAQYDEGVALNPRKSHVGDHERPFPGLQFGQEHLAVGDDPDAPPFGIQDLFDRTCPLGIVIEDKNADLLGDSSGTSTHAT